MRKIHTIWYEMTKMEYEVILIYMGGMMTYHFFHFIPPPNELHTLLLSFHTIVMISYPLVFISYQMRWDSHLK